MIIKKQALEYEIGRRSIFQMILHEIPLYNMLFNYKFNLRYHRYQEWMNDPLHQHNQITKSNI